MPTAAPNDQPSNLNVEELLVYLSKCEELLIDAQAYIKYMGACRRQTRLHTCDDLLSYLLRSNPLLCATSEALKPTSVQAADTLGWLGHASTGAVAWHCIDWQVTTVG